MNINLTPEQAELVDKASRERGFANRSEFLRSLLRYVFFYSPHILERLDTIVFEEPQSRNADYIISEFEKSGKYNRRFLESVAAGLKKSEYFAR